MLCNAVQVSSGISRKKAQGIAGGFTLIELLVVVAIIAVFMAIMLPSLGAARDQARATVCATHLRQIGLGLQAYLSEDDNYLPHGATTSGTSSWQAKLAPYTLNKSASEYTSMTNYKLNVYTCPQVPSNELPIAYTANAYLGAVTTGDQPDPTQPYKITKFSQPSVKAFVVDTRIGAVSRIRTMYFAGHATDPTYGIIELRHLNNTKANVCFLDGHVEAYASPAIPRVRDDVTGGKWLLPTVEGGAPGVY